MKKVFLSICVAAMLAGCANSVSQSKISHDEKITQDWATDRLYSEARDELNGGNYPRAVTLYELLRAREPDGRYAEQALLEEAYAQYKNEDAEKALISLARFEQNYPGSANMDYALYLRGLVLFAEDPSFINKLASQDWSDRDPASNQKAYYAFESLVKRFPTSRYADDARKRMSQLVDALGGHEMAIARYYVKRGAYVAANNRAQQVIAHYQNTRYVEEALAIMKYSYEKMNQPQLANDTYRVIQQNFPNSPYLQKDWRANDMPWWRYWK